MFLSVETLILGGLHGMGNEGDLAKVSGVAVEAANILKVDMKNWKLERLKCEVRVAEKKVLQSKRLLEEACRKGSLAIVTISSYFLTSCNAEKPMERLQLREKEN